MFADQFREMENNIELPAFMKSTKYPHHLILFAVNARIRDQLCQFATKCIDSFILLHFMSAYLGFVADCMSSIEYCSAAQIRKTTKLDD